MATLTTLVFYTCLVGTVQKAYAQSLLVSRSDFHTQYPPAPIAATHLSFLSMFVALSSSPVPISHQPGSARASAIALSSVQLSL